MEYPELEICCDKLRELTEIRVDILEYGDDGEKIHVTGCCGGGCYILYDMKFCPYCAVPITIKPK